MCAYCRVPRGRENFVSKFHTMGNLNYFWVLTVWTVLILVKSGESLRCWTCSGNELSLCSDYFNSTDLQRTLHLLNYQDQISRTQTYPKWENCDNIQLSFSDGRMGCLKQITKNPDGTTTYKRQCYAFQPEESTGKCRLDTYVKFCEVCGWDGCNGAEGLKIKNFAIIISSTIIALIYKKLLC